MKKWIRLALYAALFMGAAGTTAILTISFLVESGQEVVVPSVVGKSSQEAEHLLASRGLVIEVQRLEMNDHIAKGSVTSQYPIAEETVQVGRTVRVNLSKGPRERRAPRVIGLTRKAAHQVLKSSSLPAHDAARSCSDRYRMDVVLAQDPPSGEVVSSEGVDLLISTGSCNRRFLMPDVVLRSYQETLPLFYEAGFFSPILHREVRNDLPEGTVFLTKPSAGGTIEPYEPIEFWVATSPSSEKKEKNESLHGDLKYISVKSKPSLTPQRARLWLRRPEEIQTYAMDVQLKPGKNSEFVFWLPKGSLVRLVSKGKELWRKEY